MVPFFSLVDAKIFFKMAEKSSSYETNGAGAAKGSKSAFGVGPSFKEQPDKPLKANRDGISKAFAQLSHWVHATESPFPTQTGQGTFAVTKRPGLKQDLKAMTKKGTSTCRPVRT